MDDDIDIDELKEKHLCYKCVGDRFYSDKIHKTGAAATCNYCGQKRKCFQLDEVAGDVSGVFDEHYYKTSDPDYYGERLGDDVVYAIGDCGGFPDEAAADIQKILEDENDDFEMGTMGEECEFATGSCYLPKGIDPRNWEEMWMDLRSSLKARSRYFNRDASVILDKMLKDLESLPTEDDRDLIVSAGPGTNYPSLYRARTFQSITALEAALKTPAREIGSPPMEIAAAGRMNARGISVFYGAIDKYTALAEVRPPVGSWTVVGRFDIIRHLKLLDLTALKAVTISGSLFDYAYGQELERIVFLQGLTTRMTRPVMPHAEELEYILTQAIADYLSANLAPELDGIIYPSVQAPDGLNVVLFNKAARVTKDEETGEIEVNTNIYRSDDDDADLSIAVWEAVSPKAETNVEDEDPLGLSFKPYHYQYDPDADVRLDTLTLNRDTIVVKVVQAVKYKANEIAVTRHRFDTTKDAFDDDNSL